MTSNYTNRYFTLNSSAYKEVMSDVKYAPCKWKSDLPRPKKFRSSNKLINNIMFLFHYYVTLFLSQTCISQTLYILIRSF